MINQQRYQRVYKLADQLQFIIDTAREGGLSEYWEYDALREAHMYLIKAGNRMLCGEPELGEAYLRSAQLKYQSVNL